MKVLVKGSVKLLVKLKGSSLAEGSRLHSNFTSNFTGELHRRLHDQLFRSPFTSNFTGPFDEVFRFAQKLLLKFQ